MSVDPYNRAEISDLRELYAKAIVHSKPGGPEIKNQAHGVCVCVGRGGVIDQSTTRRERSASPCGGLKRTHPSQIVFRRGNVGQRSATSGVASTTYLASGGILRGRYIHVRILRVQRNLQALHAQGQETLPHLQKQPF